MPSGKSLGYGDLAVAASALPTPSLKSLSLKSSAEFRYIGKGNVPITDLHNITTGKAMYA